MAAEREWIILEQRPWRPREKLEAEVEWLRAALEFSRTFAWLQTEKLIEAEKRQVGPPQKRAWGKRRKQQLQAEAKKRVAAGQPEFGYGPLYDGWIRQALLAHKLIREKRRSNSGAK